MAKIYDFASRRPIQTAQNAVENEKDVPGGKYIGNIGESNARAFQSTVTVLENVIERYLAIQAELDEITGIHERNMGFVLDMLQAQELFDEETEDLMVSENGHVWIVPVIEGDKDNAK